MSARSAGCVGRAVLVFGALMFILMGAPFVWLLLGRPTLELLRSRSWDETRCEVLYSGVQPGEDGGRYRALVAYAYTAAGRERVSADLEVQPRDLPTEDAAKAAAAAWSAGQGVPCWVSPADPTRAVLLRRFNPATLIGLLPGLFPLAGLGLLYLAFAVKARPKTAQAADWLGAAPPMATALGGPRGASLRSGTGPVGQLVGLLFINLIWNGITGAFIFMFWRDGGFSRLEPAMLCFLPFPLIGLLLLGSIPYQFLALFNPRPYLTLSQPALLPGQSVRLRWELRPMGWRVRRVRLTLEGSERGPSGNAATARVFLSQPLAQREGADAAAGEAELGVPEGVMHSFKSTRYELAWRVKLVAEIPIFPDVQQEFEVTVLPQGRQR